jgi:hypothetical protein
MFGKMIDAGRQNRDLHFARPGVLVVRLVLSDNFLLVANVCHVVWVSGSRLL